MFTPRHTHAVRQRSGPGRASTTGFVVVLVVAIIVTALTLRPGTESAVAPAPAGIATPRATVPLIDVIGDSYVGGSDEGGYGDTNWTRIVGSRFYADHHPVDLTASAHPGSGYLVRGIDKLTYIEGVSRSLRPDTDLVIVFGSRNDGRQDPATMSAGAADLYAAVHERAPHARLLVVGPAWVDADVPSFIRSNSRSIEAAAVKAGATFVDPLKDRWFFGADSRYIGGDGVHPTNEGHRYMAEKLYAAIARELSRTEPSAPPATG